MDNNVNRFLMWFVILSSMVIVVAYPAIAITINSVSVAEPDTFYSSVANNSVVRLTANITGVNNTPGNSVAVTANFISLGVNCNDTPGSSVISLANNGGDLWTGVCDVSQEAGATTFKSGQVIVIANETYGNSPGVNTNLILSLYNIGIPSGNSCYQFGEGTTNFNQITNFNDVDITLVIETAADSSCTGKIMSWGGSSWLKVGKLKFNGVNFEDNNDSVKKLSQLSNIVKFTFSLPNTYQNTRVFVDTAVLPELDVDTFNVELYHLSMMVPNNGFIVSDNNVLAEAITWTSNGFESMMNANTYNLTFTVSQGFKGYNITDNIAPVAVLHSPLNGLITNVSSVNVNFTVNGTGTSVSKVFFYLNGAMVASYNGTINTANCTPTDSTLEVYRCLFNIARTDGTYNLSVVSYDFGRSPGNLITTNVSYNVQTSPPTLKISLPRTGEEYKGTVGSMLKLSFNVSDGNGISSCWYSLDGPTSADDEPIKNCVSGTNTIQLYLEDGSYDLELYANDTLGMTSTESISFEVSDDDAPKILNYTVKISKDEALLTIITDEFAECKYDSSDNPYVDMDDELDENITRHTALFDVSDRDSDDVDLEDYTYYIRCSDVSGNSNEGSLIINLLDSSIVSNLSTVEDLSVTITEPSKDFDLGLLLAGRKILNIDDVGIPFTDMLLITNSAVDDVTVKVTALLNSTIVYPEKVYSYISVEHSGLKDSHIDDVLIKFKVSKKWLTDNDFGRNDTVLLRYDGEWVVLNTTAGADSGDYVTYTANSPGLSLFAISRRHVDVPVNVSLNATDANISANETVAVTDDKDAGDRGFFNWIWILLGVVVFVIVVLFILVERNERNSPPPIFPQDRTIAGRIRRLFR